MSTIDVVMPKMGESIMEGTITKWFKKVGDSIGRDETLLEISTDKVDSEIPSPGSGIVSEILFAEQQTIPVHTIIARIVSRELAPQSREQTAAVEETLVPQVSPAAQSSIASARSSEQSSDRFYSPLVMKIAQEEGISLSELELISGTGAGGRVSKNDMLAFAAARKQGSSIPVAGMGLKDDVITMDTMR
ncbi:MAG: E3 binding domain-containing protein, partial [Ignavibacteriales bacterium]|nr:E3 binding domain-containing protein [Ignavibacteriales bacterium]